LLEFLVSNCTLANGRIAVTLKQPLILETVSAVLSTKATEGLEKSKSVDWLGNQIKTANHYVLVVAM
jgi:hypothetical protein